MSRTSGGSCSSHSGPKRVLYPTFELVSNPTISIPALTKSMRARKAQAEGCIVVWDKGENPCNSPVVRDLVQGVMRDAKRR